MLYRAAQVIADRKGLIELSGLQTLLYSCLGMLKFSKNVLGVDHAICCHASSISLMALRACGTFAVSSRRICFSSC